MRILLAEDERPLARALVKILEKNNYSVDAVYNGLEALDYLRADNYDAVILDIMMPELDGIGLLQQLRREKNPIPVLILTAKAEVDDKVLGLDSGANDYLTKPFDTKELLARLRAMTRVTAALDCRLSFGNVTLNTATYELSSPTAGFRLANKEFQIMELLMSKPGSLFPAERLLERVWGYDTESDVSIVWVYISYLRKKLSALQADIQIIASRNAGYALEERHD